MRTTIVPRLLIVFASFATTHAQEYPTAQTVADTLATECFSKVDRASEIAPRRAKSAGPEHWWQSGFVEHEGKWIRFDKAIEQARDSSFQSTYERLAKSSHNQHQKLARLCLKHKRWDQYRVHMLALMQDNPALATPDTLTRIGMLKVANRWLAPEAAYALAKEQYFTEESIRKWATKLNDIREGIISGGKNQELAESLLAEIESPDAVLAIDAILGSGPVRCQRAAVQTLARIESVRSSQRLVYCAALNPTESVRSAAIDALKHRPKEHYVPWLLDRIAVVKPTLSEQQVVWYGFLPTGYTQFTLQIETETSKQKRVLRSSAKLVVDYRIVGDQDDFGFSPNGDLVDFRYGGRLELPPASVKKSKIQIWKHRQRLRGKYVANAGIDTQSAVNRPILSVLNETCEPTSDDPRAWWTWWNSYTDVDAPVKEVLEVEQHQESQRVTFNVALSCFASGTLVLTETGSKPIETVRVGERVLSQDPDTGELRFRVVQKTTVRPPRKTYSLSFGKEQIRCTGGHNFWKAGAGWVKARDLEVGNRIRTPTGTEAVTAVATGEPAKTYNLVVEGFHTYFVGDSKLLVQDVLPITPTDNVLPGFSKFELGEDATKSHRSE